MSCESNGPDLVTFNVGGKIYQVLREPTLSLHPTSLLTQLADDQKDDKPIFVEGDQDLFKFVIEYHRDRKVHLPITVSKDAVLRELKRFNLEPAADQIVEDERQLGKSLASVRKRLSSWADDTQKRQKAFAAELMGNLVAQAAARMVSDKETGAGVAVRLNDVVEKIPMKVGDSTFMRLFEDVEAQAVAESETCKEFAHACGYSMTIVPGSCQVARTWCSSTKLIHGAYFEFKLLPSAE